MPDSGLDKLFITGVSPVTMDDVTSGFNIGSNVSLNKNINEFMGFTETLFFNTFRISSKKFKRPKEKHKIIDVPNYTINCYLHS